MGKINKSTAKKIYIITENKTLDFNFLSDFLSDVHIDFVVWSINDYKTQKEIEENIVNADIEELKNGRFNAKIFQSFSKNIPTRLLIPEKFSSLDGWNKNYILLHELGHYFSLEDKLISGYVKYLEDNRYHNELVNIPLEIEAEKYVFKIDKKLFKKNINNIYLGYLKQIKNNIQDMNKENIKNWFDDVIVIRLFRYSAIISSILNKETKTFKKHKKNIEEIERILIKKIPSLKSTLYFVEFNLSIEKFYKNKDFDLYTKNCINIYSTNGIKLYKTI